MLAAIGVAGEMLATILEPADVVAGAARQPGQRHLLPAEQALVAEAAADVGRITLMAPSGRPRHSAMPRCTTCGIWLALITVRNASRGSQ